MGVNEIVPATGCILGLTEPKQDGVRAIIQKPPTSNARITSFDGLKTPLDAASFPWSKQT